MHFYFITRGIKKEVDDFINQLQGKYVPFKWRATSKEPMGNHTLQLRVQPIQLWDVAFPEDQRDMILTTIMGKEKRATSDSKLNKWLDKLTWGFRKMLKCEKVPEYKTDLEMPISRQHMTVLGIGIKKDGILPTGVEAI